MCKVDRCDDKVYKRGTPVFLTHSLGTSQIEAWVQLIARESGQRVDWSWVGGRALVKALGNIKKVKATIQQFRSIHDQYYRDTVRGLLFSKDDREINRTLDGIWDYNYANYLRPTGVLWEATGWLLFAIACAGLLVLLIQRLPSFEFVSH